MIFISHVSSIINAKRVHHLQDLESCLLPFLLVDLSLSLGSVPIKVSERVATWPEGRGDDMRKA